MTKRKTQIQINLDVDQADRLREIAKRSGVPMAEYVREFVRAGLDGKPLPDHVLRGLQRAGE